MTSRQQSRQAFLNKRFKNTTWFTVVGNLNLQTRAQYNWTFVTAVIAHGGSSNSVSSLIKPINVNLLIPSLSECDKSVVTFS